MRSSGDVIAFEGMSIPVIESKDDPRNVNVAIFLGTIALVVIVSIIPSTGDGIAKSAKRHLLICFALVVVPFLPSCGLILEVGYVLAERLLYIPSHGVCLLAALLIESTLAAVMGAGSSKPDAEAQTESETEVNTKTTGTKNPKKKSKAAPPGTTTTRTGGNWASPRGTVFAAIVVLLCSVASNKTRERSPDWNTDQRLVASNPLNQRKHYGM